MIKKSFIFVFLGIIITSKSSQAQVVTDTVMANVIHDACPACIDMSTQNLTPYASIVDSLIIWIDPAVTSFEGLQYFTGLTKLNIGIPFWDLYNFNNNYAFPTFYLPPNITQLIVGDNANPTGATYMNGIQLDIPNSVTHLDLSGFGPDCFNLPPNLEYLKMSWMGACILQYPTTALKEMILHEYINVNPIAIPASVERLTLTESSSNGSNGIYNTPIISTNSNLRYLKYESIYDPYEFYDIDYNSFPNLDTLIAIDVHPTFINGMPQNLKYLKLSSVYNFNMSLINNQLDSLKTLILIDTGDPNAMPQLANNIENLYFYYGYGNSNGPFVFNSPLPNSLKHLTVVTDPSNICFPTLPQGLLHLESSFKNNSSGTSFTACLPNQPPQLQVTSNNLAIFPPICASNLPNCYDFQLPTVSGKCYLDLNSNSIFDGFGEPLLSYPIQKEELATGTISYIYPNNNYYNGIYDFIDTSSTYLYEVVNSNINYTAPAPSSIISNNQSAQFFDLNLAVTPNQSFDDVEMWYANTWDFSPGSINHISTLVRNNGTNIANGTINISFDPLLSIYNSNGGIVNGNTLSFPINNLASGAIQHYNFQTYLNTSAQFGDTVELSFNAIIVGNDIDTTNNNYIINSPVLAAYDPNDINVDKTILSSTNVQQNAYLTYTIRFQNTGNAAAQNVYLTDSLSNYLDPAYFEVIYSEHSNYQIQFLNTNDPSKPYVLKVIYNNINLPDSNANEPESHGKFVFKIKVKNNTGLGSIIPASAAIYFDYSPAVITNMVTTLIMDPTKINYNSQMNFVSLLAPNPANEIVNILIKSNDNAVISLNFFNNSGQLIKSQEKQVVKGQNLLEQSLLNLSPGFYLLKISDAEGKPIGMHKLVKQ
jgi:uncharacterized repeat protein (TIGR01451 family)